MQVDWGRVAIVTAADTGYAATAIGLVRSLRDAEAALGGARLRVHVLDLGLGPDDRRALADIARLVEVAPPLPLVGPPERRAFVLSRMVKAFLPMLVPGFLAYIWLDADTWVQTADALTHLMQAMRRVDCAAVPEIDPSYGYLFRADSVERQVMLRRLERNCGKAAGRFLFTLPSMNAGVVVARRRSPVWAAWQKRVADACQRAGRIELLSDQAALNAALYLDGVPFMPLSADMNWLMSGALPAIDAEGFLVTPRAPHRRIGICHLTHLVGKGPFAVRRVGGARIPLHLDYQTIAAWRADTAAAAGAPP
ncbi:MAG: hypothetical protein IT561_20470 [Alphaproteobacteria bacterium]|nr:hypothetical protein [Alphaproteobacteria bacterium]